MLPVLTEIPGRGDAAPVSTGRAGPHCARRLKRFPYEEHPCNARSSGARRRAGINEDSALKELADRVVGPGVLKTSPISWVRRRRLQLPNGCSANERHGTISNWLRCGFDVRIR